MPEQEVRNQETDESLMAQFQGGAAEAFQIIFDRYAARIASFAYRFLSNQEEAEDVAQEVLVRIYKSKDRYDPDRPFRPWVFAIASRLLSNRRRDRKRRAHESLDWEAAGADGGAPAGPQVPDPSPDASPERAAERKQLAESVREALRALPENQRTAVLLARFEAMSYEEIAETMDVSVSAVKSLLFRARESLKQRLAPGVAGTET